MAGQFNIPGSVDLDVLKEVYNRMSGNTGYTAPRQTIVERPVIGEAIQDFVQRQEQVKQPTKNINLSQRAERINKAIEDWQAAKSKQTVEGIKRGAAATGKAVKGGINYMKPIAKLGGKVAGVASIPLSIYEGVTAEDPFERGAAIATGIGGAGMMFGGSPYITVPSAVLTAGGIAAPYIRDWVESSNRQREANRASERQFLEEELKRRGLL